MKKINSIGYGHYILAIGILFLAAVPVTLYILAAVFGLKSFENAVLMTSLTVGAAVFMLLVALLIIELRQDKRLNAAFEKNKNTKLKLKDGSFECQNCGSRTVKNRDESCPACGIVFKQAKEDSK